MSERLAMSVEQPLWRALTGYRLLTLGYAVSLFAINYADYARVWIGLGYLLVLTGWTLSTLRQVSSTERCTPWFLAGDISLALAGILLSPVADPEDMVNPTLPSIWVAGAVLAFAIKAGWRWAAGASVLVGSANLLASGGFERATVHNVLLVCVAAVAIGYVVEVARASERTLARALRIEAATRERERLARDIHDGVLQVLVMVRRRAGALGGEAAELGRLAGEQEVALRRLVSGAALPQQTPGPAAANDGRTPAAHGREHLAPGTVGGGAEPVAAGEQGPVDVRAVLAGYADSVVTFSGPAGPVRLPAEEARQLAAAVAAALDNVRQHAAAPGGEPAPAWVLLEDEPDELLVTVRDEGPGIPAGRLAAAKAEGRLGASLSIRGRLTELGGTAEWISLPGQGTEVELRMPKR